MQFKTLPPLLCDPAEFIQNPRRPVTLQLPLRAPGAEDKKPKQRPASTKALPAAGANTELGRQV